MLTCCERDQSSVRKVHERERYAKPGRGLVSVSHQNDQSETQQDRGKANLNDDSRCVSEQQARERANLDQSSSLARLGYKFWNQTLTLIRTKESVISIFKPKLASRVVQEKMSR